MKHDIESRTKNPNKFFILPPPSLLKSHPPPSFFRRANFLPAMTFSNLPKKSLNKNPNPASKLHAPYFTDTMGAEGFSKNNACFLSSFAHLTKDNKSKWLTIRSIFHGRLWVLRVFGYNAYMICAKYCSHYWLQYWLHVIYHVCLLGFPYGLDAQKKNGNYVLTRDSNW